MKTNLYYSFGFLLGLLISILFIQILYETILCDDLAPTSEELLSFEQFQIQFDKKYESYREYLIRQRIFIANLR